MFLGYSRVSKYEEMLEYLPIPSSAHAPDPAIHGCVQVISALRRLDVHHR